MFAHQKNKIEILLPLLHKLASTYFNNLEVKVYRLVVSDLLQA